MMMMKVQLPLRWRLRKSWKWANQLSKRTRRRMIMLFGVGGAIVAVVFDSFYHEGSSTDMHSV
jgi:hypothetical protein